MFYSKATNEPLMTPETLAHIEKVFAEKGSDAWFELEVAALLPESLRHLADAYTKVTFVISRYTLITFPHPHL